MKEKYTPNAREVLKEAYRLAEGFGQSYIGTEHLLLSLVENEGVAKDILLKNGLKIEQLFKLIRSLVVLDGFEYRMPIKYKNRFIKTLKNINWR